MKRVGIAILLAMFSLFGATHAQACRIATPPSALLHSPADMVLLVRIKSVDGAGQQWRATARAWALLSGTGTAPDLSFSSESHSAVCNTMWAPRIGSYWVLYVQRTADGMRVIDATPYWWARRSGDPRLARLNELLPLGAIREPTRDETRMLELAEPRVRLPEGAGDLSAYTRIYARSSAGTLRVRLLRSQTPRRLMTNESEEMPTEEICGCTIIEQFVDLSDLWAAGRLPPFGR